MRTETDLREALLGLADTAHDPDELARRLQLAPTRSGTPGRPGRPGRPRRPRRSLVAVVAVCAAVFAVVLAVTVVPLLTIRLTEPADLRKPGYWGFVSQVDLPGWRVDLHGVEGAREYLRLTSTAGTSISCEVTVYGRGAFPTTLPTGTPTDVAGRPGIHVAGNDVEPELLAWPYDDDAWALVTCFGPQPVGGVKDDVFVRVAEAVRFEPNAALLPIRLTALPSQYEVKEVSMATIDERPVGALTVAAPDRPSLSIFNATTPFEAAGPGMPGVEEHTVDGRTVRVREDQRAAQITVGDRYVTISSSGSSTGRQSWDPGEREAILDIAAHLRVADDLDDPSTWFDAARTVPR